MALPKIDVPIYEATLPSNNQVVKFRPFLVKEQKLLLMSAQATETKEIIIYRSINGLKKAKEKKLINALIKSNFL